MVLLESKVTKSQKVGKILCYKAVKKDFLYLKAMVKINK